MKKRTSWKNLYLVPAATFAVACGAGSSTTDPAFASNLPSYSSESLSMDSTDSAPPASASIVTTNGAALTTSDGSELETAGDCHPHLFARTHEVVRRLNSHVNILLAHVADVVADNPKMASGSQHVWENVKDGIDRKFTMTKAVDGGVTSFAYELDLAIAGTAPNFVKVYSGTRQGTGVVAAVDGGAAGGPAQVQGSATFDFTALSQVVTKSHAQGQMSFTFDRINISPKSRKAVITFTNFTPAEGNPHGPRNGSYVYESKPGVGGSLKFQDDLILLCPANPQALVASVDVITEWYTAADGTLHGRADALGTKGQIPTGNTWQGVTCHTGTAASAANETYWMMKEENASGATLQGSAVSSTTSSPSACDPAFVNGKAVVPSLTDSLSDFPFAASFNADGSMKDNNPFLFPLLG